MWSWLAVGFWMVGILYTSSLGQAVTPVSGPLQTLVAKIGHIVEYAILGGLVCAALIKERGGATVGRGDLLLALLVSGLFAVADEVRQAFSPGREPRVTDVLLDCASALAGMAALRWWLLPRAADRVSSTRSRPNGP